MKIRLFRVSGQPVDRGHPGVEKVVEITGMAELVQLHKKYGDLIVRGQKLKTVLDIEILDGYID